MMKAMRPLVLLLALLLLGLSPPVPMTEARHTHRTKATGTYVSGSAHADNSSSASNSSSGSSSDSTDNSSGDSISNGGSSATGNAEDQCARLDEESLPSACMVLRRVCVQQDTIVTHDWQYSFANPQRDPLPVLPVLDSWNFPAVLEANTDALHGRAPTYQLSIRQASAHEPTEALRNPVFSNCTLPVIIVCDFPYNMGEFFAKTVSSVDLMALDDRVTLVLMTPQGLGLAAFHSVMLMPYSRYPAVTAADLGSRGCSDPGVGSEGWSCPDGKTPQEGFAAGDGCRGARRRPVPWSSEPTQPHCFERLVMCKWSLANRGGTLLSVVGDKLVKAAIRSGLLPPSAVQYRGGGGDQQGGEAEADPRNTTTLRVLIETRHGPVRNIKNLQELLEACKERDRKGFSAGPFSGLDCAAISFSAPDGSVDRTRFLDNLSAVRSAHVLVVLHGAGATNSWFMRQGSSALIEVRPCGFGTRFASWPDKYMPLMHRHNGYAVRFFALNIEDPEQCLQGDIEASLRNHTAKREAVGWDSSYFARDQHVMLRPRPFLEFVRHAGELLTDLEQYQEAEEEEQLHGYVVPEGLVYGKLGISEIKKYIAEERPKLFPAQHERAARQLP